MACVNNKTGKVNLDRNIQAKYILLSDILLMPTFGSDTFQIHATNSYNDCVRNTSIKRHSQYALNYPNTINN